MNQSKELLGRHLTWSMLKKRVSGLNTKSLYMDFVGVESIETMLHGCGCEYRIRYGTGAAIRYFSNI
jgi:hypothetical protein